MADQGKLKVVNAELRAQIKQAEEALRYSEQRIRELATESIHAHEEERQWVALEVHDRILQLLVAAHQQIQTLESKAWAGSEGRQVERVLGLVQEAINEARNVMNDLYPAGLTEFGLIPLMVEKLGVSRTKRGVWWHLKPTVPRGSLATWRSPFTGFSMRP